METMASSTTIALDDVVQEALIIVNRKLGSVDDLQAFGAWLARVVTRLCLLPPCSYCARPSRC